MACGCASSTELPTTLLRGIYDFLEEKDYQKKLSIVLKSSELSFTSSQKHARKCVFWIVLSKNLGFSMRTRPSDLVYIKTVKN